MSGQQETDMATAIQHERTVVFEREATPAEQAQLSAKFEPYRFGDFNLQHAEVRLARIGGAATTLAILDHNRDAADVISKGIRNETIDFQTSDLENVSLFSTPIAIRDEAGASRQVFFGLRLKQP